MSLLPLYEAIDEDMVAIMRQKTEAERLMIGMRLWRTARALMGAGIRADHPHWTEVDVNREIARRVRSGAIHAADRL